MRTILIFLFLVFGINALAVPCEEALSNELERLEKTLTNKRATKMQLESARSRIREMLASTSNSPEFVDFITASYDWTEKANALIPRQELEGMLMDYLMRPENRDAFYDSFVDVFFPIFLDEFHPLDGDISRARRPFDFMNRLLQEDGNKFAAILLKGINEADLTSMQVNAEGLGAVLKAYRNTQAEIETAGEDVLQDDHHVQLQMERKAYFTILVHELQRPVATSDINTWLSTEHDDVALAKSNQALQEDGSRFVPNVDIERDGGLKPVLLHYRLIQHFMPALQNIGTPRLLGVVREIISEISSGQPAPGAMAVRYFSYMQTNDQKAIVSAIDKDPNFKRTLFSKASLVGELRTPQRWLTIYSPEKVRAHLLAQFENAQLKGRVSRALKQRLGKSWADIEADPEFLRYYADEVYDVFTQEGGKALREEAFKIRFFRRQLAELKLGDRCGDCTSVGSVNFARSATWFYNPGYQILTFSKGSRFLGKVGLALVDIDAEPSILIDALEFNPQALPGKPYYNDEKAALDFTLAFIIELAKEEHRSLFALARSNSTEANSILKQRGIPGYNVHVGKVRFAYDEASVRSVLQLEPSTKLAPFYQTVDMAGDQNVTVYGVQVPSDPHLIEFENAIVNPAQSANADLGRLLTDSINAENETEQDSILQKAARVIMANPEWMAQVHTLYQVPSSLPLNWKFIAGKLKRLYPSSRGERFLSQSVNLTIGNIVVPLYRPN